MRSGAALRLLVLALLAVLAAGCTVSQPDRGDWQPLVDQTLEDSISEVATARLTYAQAGDGRLQTTYAVTVLAEAEEAISKAEESLSTAQPPARRSAEAERLLELVGKASDAVRAAREAAVDDRFHDPAVLSALDRVRSALDDERLRQQDGA